MGPPQPFLTADWQHLAMLSFEVDPEVLVPYLPRATELDLYRGSGLVSVLGVRFCNTRIRGFAVPLHRNFPEVNVRFYVRRRTDEGIRRGVVALKEVVPKRAVAFVARTLFKEDFVTRRMRNSVVSNEQGIRVEYQWSDPRWHGLHVLARGAPVSAEADSEEAFVTQRHWGYRRLADGRTSEIRIERPEWRIWKAEDAQLTAPNTTLVDRRVARILQGSWSSALIADGSATKIYSSVVVR